MLLFLLSMVAFAAPAKSFREYVVGGPCPTGDEWSMGEMTDNLRVWTRQDEKMSIGDAVLTNVDWLCWDTDTETSVLAGVMLRFPNTSGPPLLETLTLTWGSPLQANKYIQSYLWMGGPVSGYLSYNNIDGGVLLLSHTATMNQVRAAKQSRAAAASDDL